MPNTISTFSRRTINDLERHLRALLKQSGAKGLLIVHRSGYVLCSSGMFSTLNPQDLGVVAAATFAAIRKMATLADSDEMSIRFHSPKIEKIFFAILNPHVFLTVLYDTSTTGRRVRDTAREFVNVARRLLAAPSRRSRKTKPVPSIAKDLERLFRDESLR
jgi:hypothetical protein